ncbi:MAG TPA: tryptophan--tRNA ligase [Firmicutes bacterium]|nr:tryptophan--tRNA ligase [Bacillota bacterium]
MNQERETVLSGMRPTGRLHLGNLLGALDNWVKMQDQYRCFFPVVDWHALTTGYEDTAELRENIYQMVVDWLSAGLDPKKCVIFRQSHVKEHAELHLLLSMITPLAWLERVPTYKEQLRELQGREIATYGFLGYPVLMAADILVYKATKVPVGEDQLPHLELTREIVRRFNYLYKPVFPEPQALLNRVTLLPGLDGRKMSKSYGNQIDLSATPEEVKAKVESMITDPARIKKSDPGHPDVCAVFQYRKIFMPRTIGETEEACRGAKVGCVQCKRELAKALVDFLAPITERRRQVEAQPGLVEDVLRDGAARAREVASQTLAEVRDVMGI